LWVFFFLFFPPFLPAFFCLGAFKELYIGVMLHYSWRFFSPPPRCFGLCLLRHESFRGRRFEHFLCIEIGDGSSWLHHVLRSLSFPYGLARNLCLWRKKKHKVKLPGLDCYNRSCTAGCKQRFESLVWRSNDRRREW
jgi:hypothetical protein